jgi:hypothetical protein
MYVVIRSCCRAGSTSAPPSQPRARRRLGGGDSRTAYGFETTGPVVTVDVVTEYTSLVNEMKPKYLEVLTVASEE